MKKQFLCIILVLLGYVSVSSLCVIDASYDGAEYSADSLRAIYSGPANQWPRPWVDSNSVFTELQALPEFKGIVENEKNPRYNLGKYLFFDPILSHSSQISCSSCHDPEIGWGDGRSVSLGTDHLQGSRNTMTLLNVVAQKALFWDGRAKSLREQAMGPITAHHEMDMKAVDIPAKLQKMPFYDSLYRQAFKRTKKMNLDSLLSTIVFFEETIHSRKSRFDLFLSGNKQALTDQEVEGLHLFRTKARCINCHNGAYFSDFQFHNIGLTYYKRKYQDLGRYGVTHRAEDIGRFKTAMLRDVLYTGPWMHNGLFDDLDGIVRMYNSGIPISPKTEADKKDSLFPRNDVLIKKLNLSREEQAAVVAFLKSISTAPYKMRRPELPPR